jgi:hypothetical protein
MPDPASVSGGKAEIEAAFAATYDKLHQRISALVALPFHQLPRAEAKATIDRIGAH